MSPTIVTTFFRISMERSPSTRMNSIDILTGAIPIRRHFVQTFGESISYVESRLYSGFVQDQWRPRPWVMLNVGARFDYVKALGVSSKPDSLAPRVAASVDPWRKGRTALRGGAGRYYDSLYVQFVRVDALADRQITIRIVQSAVYAVDPRIHMSTRLILEAW